MGQGIVGGRLKLKGMDKKKKKKKKKKQKRHADGTALSAAAADVHGEITTESGSGQILTSGTSVMGKGTKFKEEVHNGDTITVLNESTLVEETRRVVMVLGPTSMSLSAPFASDLVTHTDFKITNMAGDAGEEQTAGKKVKTDGARELVWREKTGFSYRYRREKIKKTGALDLLDMRCKKKADRMCM